MPTKPQRIYVFTNGTRIDLKKVMVIGAIDKDEIANIFIPIYCEGFNKPINLILSNCIGTLSNDRKLRIESIYSHFTSEWQAYKLSID